MQAEDRAGLGRRERVLHLVAVAELRRCRQDRLERQLGETCQSLERVAHPLLLRRDLGVVREILEAASAAGGEVRARRHHALRPRDEHLRRECLRVPALHLRHPGAHRVAGQASPDEDDEAVEARDAVPSVGERLDRELELLVSLHGGGHRRKVVVPGRLLQDGHEHGASPRPVELAEEDALPGAELELSVDERDHDLGAHQRGADVRGRVLLALLDVQPAPPFGRDPLEGHFEVAGDHRVGVLVDRQPRSRVRDVDEHGCA